MSDMRQKPLRSSRQAHPLAVAATLATGIVVVGGAGFALAVNDLARWVVVVAAAGAILTAWTEGRHVAATKKQIASLGIAPRPRTPADDNPQFFAGQ